MKKNIYKYHSVYKATHFSDYVYYLKQITSFLLAHCFANDRGIFAAWLLCSLTAAYSKLAKHDLCSFFMSWLLVVFRDFVFIFNAEQILAEKLIKQMLVLSHAWMMKVFSLKFYVLERFFVAGHGLIKDIFCDWKLT